MAPITKHKRTYFTAVAIVVVSVVVCLGFFLNSRLQDDKLHCLLRPVYKEDHVVDIIWYTSVFDPGDGSPTLPPIPTPTPQVTWRGLEKTSIECRGQVVHNTFEQFELSIWTYVAVYVFLLAVAATLSAIGITLYLFIRSFQLKNREDIAKRRNKLIRVLAVGGASCLLLCIIVLTESHVWPASNYRTWNVGAPIIYLYDDECREATVKLDLDGELTCTYPTYNDGWTVKTSPDGTLTDANGRKYEYLFWEADLNMDPDTTRGFCVKNSDTAAFLEEALAELGLSDTEANTFIMYWLPIMEENPYNMIYFQTDVYENAAKLEVTPTPDTIVRVNMFFQASDEYVEIEEQDLSSMNPSLDEREGFVVVEWGGEYISSEDAISP